MNKKALKNLTSKDLINLIIKKEKVIIYNADLITDLSQEEEEKFKRLFTDLYRTDIFEKTNNLLIMSLNSKIDNAKKSADQQQDKKVIYTFEDFKIVEKQFKA
jgi:hypothetical protein